jgi:hypothetical protein
MIFIKNVPGNFEIFTQQHAIPLEQVHLCIGHFWCTPGCFKPSSEWKITFAANVIPILDIRRELQIRQFYKYFIWFWSNEIQQISFFGFIPIQVTLSSCFRYLFRLFEMRWEVGQLRKKLNGRGWGYDPHGTSIMIRIAEQARGNAARLRRHP